MTRGAGFDRLFQEVINLGDDLPPSRLVGERHVVFAIDLHEAAVGNERCELAADFDRHHRVARDMQRQGRAFDFAGRGAHVGLPADLKEAHGCLGRCRQRLLLGPGTEMCERAARLEIRAPDLAKGVVLMAPAEAHHVEQQTRLLGLDRMIVAQAPQTISSVQDEAIDALGMARGIFDPDRAAPAGRQNVELPEAGRVGDSLDIFDPAFKGQVRRRAVGQAASARVVAQQCVFLRQRLQPGPPRKAVPLVLEMRKPGSRHDQRRAFAAHRIGKLHVIGRRTEADVLVHIARGRSPPP